MGLLTKARQLDDAVLGRSDSTRGFVMNATFGLHPYFAPWYFAIGATLLVLAVVVLATGHSLAAGESAAIAVLCIAKGYVCKRLPKLPSSNR
jgi:hypothetical protein